MELWLICTVGHVTWERRVDIWVLIQVFWKSPAGGEDTAEISQIYVYAHVHIVRAQRGPRHFLFSAPSPGVFLTLLNKGHVMQQNIWHTRWLKCENQNYLKELPVMAGHFLL